VEEQNIPEDLHPRVLIQAIQENLGITKKEISERTGISYGTLNRYTRDACPIGRPRQSSINKLKHLYLKSLRKFDARDSAGKPGIEYNLSLFQGIRPVSRESGHYPGQLSGHLSPGETSGAVDIHGLPQEPFLKFNRWLVFYARRDFDHFKASEYRDRERLLSTRELVGDLYMSLVNDLVHCDMNNPELNSNSDNTDQVTEQVTEQVTDLVKDQVTDPHAEDVSSLPSTTPR